MASDGGYECEFVDVPHDDDHCVICLLPARNPQQTKCECAKLYCKSCYDNLKSTSGKCPTCRRKLDAFPDRKSARKVSSLRVKCTSIGCPWIGELGSLNDHLRTCWYVLVLCTNGCKEHIVRDKHLLHCAEECPLRRHMCKHCKAEGPYQEMISGHLGKCPDLMVPCPNSGCKVSTKRKDMASHHSECPHVNIKCPFMDIGCTYTSSRATMADHKASSSGHHLDLAMLQLKKQVTNLEMLCTPQVIKLSQFSQLKANNNTWYSPGFYTHTSGYKMCVQVYPNGCGIGDAKDTHMSVFLYLMKGEYDDTLTWPIRYKCTITLLNQLLDADHHVSTFLNNKSKCDKNNSRVLIGERSEGWGLAQFIANEKLQENQQCQYLMDDSLYFRVQVEIMPTVKPWLVPTLRS